MVCFNIWVLAKVSTVQEKEIHMDTCMLFTVNATSLWETSYMADTESHSCSDAKELTIRYWGHTNTRAFCKTFEIVFWVFFPRMFLLSLHLCVYLRLHDCVCTQLKCIYCHKNKIKMTNYQAYLKSVFISELLYYWS